MSDSVAYTSAAWTPRSLNASTISVTPRMSAVMPIHSTSNHAERPGYPSAHIAITTSMMPEARPSPQSGIRSRSTMLRMIAEEALEQQVPADQEGEDPERLER